MALLQFLDHLVTYETFLNDIAARVVKFLNADKDDPEFVSQRKAYEMFGAKRDELADYIRDDFIFEFMCYMRRPAHYRKRKDRLIEAWMESHGIEYTETNWNALYKIYQRQMDNDRVARHRQKKKSKKKAR